MITDIKDYEDRTVLAADVIVIGSGIAGAELATHLSRRGRHVLLLESGREAFDQAIQALYDVDFVGKPHRALDPDAAYQYYLDPEFRGMSRVRQFGGTSTIWTGKWKPMNAADFETRPWVADSGWPIGRHDLEAHYRSVAKDYGFGDLDEQARRPEMVAFKRELGAEGLDCGIFYWEETPTRTPERFGDVMRQSERLRVVLGATVTELRLDGDRRRVECVECRSLEGHRVRARADTVILATGALEGARLLLLSDRDLPGGIGNAHDQVGRNYVDHNKSHTGTLHPGPFARRWAREMQYGPKPRFCVSFALDEATERAHELLKHYVYLKPIYEQRRDRLRRWLQGRPACRDGNGRVARYRLKFIAEQVPQPDSRVYLSPERDALDMRKLVMDWRFTDQDRRSIATALKLLADRSEAVGLGTFDFGNRPPELGNMTDAAHQMGTTRMSASPRSGVVDRDCRVFGTDNLYVVSSGVFPTGPQYSPTYTILALARRLGEHLLDNVVSSPPARTEVDSAPV